MQITTGFGYYTQNGKIIAKYELPIGYHPDPDSGITFTEVANQAALDAITIYVSPEQMFDINMFCQDLFNGFAGDSALFPYYAVLRDLAAFKNFAGMNKIVTALVASNILSGSEQSTLNTILAKQNIILSNYTS